jgi:hypothetical protein
LDIDRQKKKTKKQGSVIPYTFPLYALLKKKKIQTWERKIPQLQTPPT